MPHDALAMEESGLCAPEWSPQATARGRNDELATAAEQQVRMLRPATTLAEALTVLSGLARLESAVREQIERSVQDCRGLRATWA